jgi:hypothetical protein
MKTSKTRARKFNATVGRIVLALVFASMIAGISITPAFGKDKDRGKGYHERGRYEHGRRVYQPPRHYYPAPVYAPPPVVYYPAPYQSPGISLVFPIRIR